MTSGALIVDKPAGPTSHDVVAVARRGLQTRQIGHAGTLDPLATGVLVLLVGRATRLSQFVVHDEKEYVANIRLGIATPTYDAEGLSDNSQLPGPKSQVSQSGSWELTIGNWKSEVGNLENVLDSFRGTFLQKPPPFSAKKVGGRRAYAQARRDEPVELKPVAVTVHELERLASADPSLLRLRLVVSAGFYVRSLAHAIGERLGCGAHLASLRRTRSGTFAVSEALSLDAVVAGTAPLMPMSRVVEGLPSVVLTEHALRLVSHGNAVGPADFSALAGTAAADHVRLLGPGGELVAVGCVKQDGLLHPQVVLV